MSTYLRDFANNALPHTGIAPGAYTSTQTGTARDFVTGFGLCAAVVHVGAVGGTNPTLDVKIQQSDDTVSGNFSDIAGATFAQQIAAGAPVIINFQRNKPYLRMVGTIAGTSPTITFGGQIYEQQQQI